MSVIQDPLEVVAEKVESTFKMVKQLLDSAKEMEASIPADYLDTNDGGRFED